MACRATDDPADEAEACSSEDADCAPRCDTDWRSVVCCAVRWAAARESGESCLIDEAPEAAPRVDDRQHRGGRGVGGVRRGGDGEVRRGQLRGERGLAGGRRLLVADQAVRGHAAGGRDGAEGGQRQPGGLRDPRERVGTGVRDRAAAVTTVRRPGATVLGDDAHRAGRRVLGGTVTSSRTRWGRPRSRGAQPSCAISIARRAALDGPGFVGTTPGPRTAGRWGAAARRRSPAPSWDVVRSGEAAGRGVGRCGRARRWADAQRPPKRNRSVTPRRHTTPSQRALRSLHRAHRFAPGTRDRSPRRTPETVTTSGPTHPRCGVRPVGVGADGGHSRSRNAAEASSTTERTSPTRPG